MLDFGGRNVYALVQLIMCTMGSLTVWRTVTQVWRGAKDGQEANKNSDNEPIQNTC